MVSTGGQDDQVHGSRRGRAGAKHRRIVGGELRSRERKTDTQGYDGSQSVVQQKDETRQQANGNVSVRIPKNTYTANAG